MVERAGFAQVPPMPPATGVEQADKMEVKQGGQQNAQPANGATVSPGFWGAPPGLTPASKVSQSANSSPKQQAADKAEHEAQRAFLEYRAAKDALLAMNPKDPAAIKAKENVEHLQDRAVEAAVFNQQCQLVAGNKNLFDGTFISNRFDSVTGDYPSGVERAQILVLRARETPTGLAYTARENVLAARARLEYAEQWLATVDSQASREQEKADAQAEVARCQQDCLAAARENVDAWKVAEVQEKDIVWRAETKRGRDFSKPLSASYDTAGIKECEAGAKDAEKMLATIREKVSGTAPMQDA